MIKVSTTHCQIALLEMKGPKNIMDKRLHLIVLAIAVLACSCTVYRPIEMDEERTFNTVSTLSWEDEDLSLSWDSEILANSRNKFLENRMEILGIRMLALRVENRGCEQFSVPGDIIFLNVLEDTLVILHFDTAALLLMTDFSSTVREPFIQFGLVSDLVSLANGANTGMDALQVYRDLEEYYIREDHCLAPGESVMGLILLEWPYVGRSMIKLTSRCESAKTLTETLE